jgi:hypothetical protein
MQEVIQDHYDLLIHQASTVLLEKRSASVEFTAEEADIRRRYMFLLSQAATFLSLKNALKPNAKKRFKEASS